MREYKVKVYREDFLNDLQDCLEDAYNKGDEEEIEYYQSDIDKVMAIHEVYTISTLEEYFNLLKLIKETVGEEFSIDNNGKEIYLGK